MFYANVALLAIQTKKGPWFIHQMYIGRLMSRYGNSSRLF